MSSCLVSASACRLKDFSCCKKKKGVCEDFEDDKQNTEPLVLSAFP